MPSHIALLRAVNIAGHNMVRMADLRDFFGALGMKNAQTLLQSGNVVFDGGRRSPASLESLFEREAAKRIALKVGFFVRKAAEWKEVIAGNPFPDAAESDPSRLAVLCMKRAPDRTHVSNLRKAIKGHERIEVNGRHAYIHYPDGFGRSRLTAQVIEKHLGSSGTARNWNTVLKLGALVGAT